ncbi:sensor histidine kinase [Halobaculum lipolyticum]|uniref:histidine kinase n=1 Tax=Halobaculum lipolyticum TaxID=3032001 RepID=A0ABD5WIL3_9EURY|nr:sensor histidine kinase [Halobaculum sp. DT31]
MRDATTVERVAGAIRGDGSGTVGRRVDEGVVRLAAAAVVSLTGAVLAVPNAVGFARAEGLAGAVLATVGTVVCVGLVVAGVVLYRSEFTGGNLLRIAGWNLLGLVVLGTVMGLHAVASGLAATAGAGTFLIGNLLAVGAAAHVIIGVFDVQRVRAGQLAGERRKLAVLGRVLRHNLRNDVTVIDGHAARAKDRLGPSPAARSTADGGVTDGEEPEAHESAATDGSRAAAVADAVESMDVVAARADRLGGYADATGRILRAYDNPVADGDTVDLAAVVAETVDAAADRYPDARVSASVPASAPVRGDVRVGRAVAELVENACEHAGERPTVEVTVERGDRTTTVVVADDGDGIPPAERATVFEDADITQTTHGTGLGLWTVRAAVDSCGGRLEVEGSTVRVTLPSAPA